MKSIAIVFALLSALLLAAPRAAFACGSGSGGGFGALIPIYVAVVGAGVGSGVMKLAFTIDDLDMAAKHVRPSRSDGAAEILSSAVGLGSDAALFALDTGGRPKDIASTLGVGLLIMGAWDTALLAHGVWAMAVGKPADTTAALDPKRRRAMLAPVLVSDGERIGAGLGAVGRF